MVRREWNLSDLEVVAVNNHPRLKGFCRVFYCLDQLLPRSLVYSEHEPQMGFREILWVGGDTLCQFAASLTLKND